MQFTGNLLQPKEFRKLNPCLNCGKRVKTLTNSKCEECKDIEIKYCEVCEIILRDKSYKYYSYDIGDTKRDNKIKPQKHPLKEFIEEREARFYNIEDGKRCEQCFDAFSYMKDTCFLCGSGFYNDKEWFKEYGNMCLFCAKMFPDIKAKSYLRRRQKGKKVKKYNKISYPQFDILTCLTV